jgi:hypothetical protein
MKSNHRVKKHKELKTWILIMYLLRKTKMHKYLKIIILRKMEMFHLNLLPVVEISIFFRGSSKSQSSSVGRRNS